MLAKDKAREVVVASILQRKVDPVKIDTINQLLMTQSNSLGVTFVNNDKNFKFQDGTVDTALLLSVDKWHLSLQGAMKLILNLKLTEMARAHQTRQKENSQKMSLPVQSAWRNPLPIPGVPDPPPARFTETPANDIIKFRGGRNTFSNIYMTSIHALNMDFKSVEHGCTFYKCLQWISLTWRIKAWLLTLLERPRRSVTRSQRMNNGLKLRRE